MKGNIKIRKTLSIIAVIIWCGVIFFFSSQNGEASTNTSDGVLKVAYDINDLNMTWELFKATFSLLVRKSAHFFEYLILGLLLTNLFNVFSLKKYYIYSLIGGILYAISDEIHQLFSSGRCSSPLDVCVDFSGFVLGVLIFCLIRYVAKRKSTKLWTRESR